MLHKNWTKKRWYVSCTYDTKKLANCNVIFQFLATCDYDPSRASSSAHSEFELLFKEGDLLKVYGEKMADDYYIAEVSTSTQF